MRKITVRELLEKCTQKDSQDVEIVDTIDRDVMLRINMQHWKYLSEDILNLPIASWEFRAVLITISIDKEGK